MKMKEVAYNEKGIINLSVYKFRWTLLQIMSMVQRYRRSFLIWTTHVPAGPLPPTLISSSAYSSNRYADELARSMDGESQTVILYDRLSKASPKYGDIGRRQVRSHFNNPNSHQSMREDWRFHWDGRKWDHSNVRRRCVLLKIRLPKPWCSGCGSLFKCIHTFNNSSPNSRGMSQSRNGPTTRSRKQAVLISTTETTRTNHFADLLTVINGTGPVGIVYVNIYLV